VVQPRNPSAIGLDFGTTNSALAFARDGESTLATFTRSDGSRTSTFRSVLFFEAPDVGPPPTAIAGPRALEDVDRVFLTGGSALVPSVRATFERRFGAQKLRGGDELTSVATGLSLVAEESLRP